MAAMLSRETMRVEHRQCAKCGYGRLALWRCRDCTMGPVMCRGCMRGRHHENPFHRIEKWTGTHFRSASLWETGNYLLAPHHKGDPMCSYLTSQMDFLEHYERSKDLEEQNLLRQPTIGISSENIELQDNDEEEIHEDDAFFDIPEGNEWSAELVDDDDDDEIEVERGESANASADTSANAPANRPKHDALQNQYIRAVHINGIHDLPLITCQCRPNTTVVEDLSACRLLPASFTNIRTVFSMEVLDHFRLCNLELKASAYQFYQLLRRLTRPMEPAQVVNLYDEFRRMSRIWRWMKKLKWAGYGHKGGDPMNVEAGKLANYCAACPQPGINLPENWKDDKNK